MTSRRCWGLMRGFRPGRLASLQSPSTPFSWKRRRQRVTVGQVVSSLFTISPVGTPSAVKATIFARKTTFWGVLRPRISRSRAPRSSSDRLMLMLSMRRAYT